MRFLTLLSGLVFVWCAVSAQDFSAYAKKTFSRNGADLNYRILYPAPYKPGTRYPLIIFLHGAAERGSDNEIQLRNGGAFFMSDSFRRKFPAIIIFPQCPANEAWSFFSFHYDSVHRQADLLFTFQDKPTVPAMLVKQLADSLKHAGIASPGSIYIGGISLGAFGTYDFIERYPNYFAAAFPISGGGDTSFARPLAKQKQPIWIFHGSSDPVVPVRYDRQYDQLLMKFGGDIRYTEYKKEGHHIWNKVFAEPGFCEWLQSKQRASQYITE